VKPEDLIPGIRALIARKLAEDHGFSRKRISEILGLSQPAITLYLQGKRAAEAVEFLSSKEGVLELIDELARRISIRGKLLEPELYEAAFNIWSSLKARAMKEYEVASIEHREKQRLLLSLRERLQAEQESAEEFMRIATRVKSDLMRVLFRIVASDCIRHADTLMAIISMIERGGEIRVDRLSKEMLNALLSREEIAHLHSLDDVKQFLPHKLIDVLIESIEDDERKHSKILKSLLELVEEREVS